jgi:hypothetical protein
MGLVISKGLTLRKGYIGTDDPDAEAYIAAVEAADEAASPGIGALETATKVAIHSFVKGAKADGFWPAIKASCILAGARTRLGALTPLVGTAPTSFNFVDGDYNRKTGLVGDGSTKYLDSNRNNNADPQNNRHAAVFSTSADTRRNFARYLAAGDSSLGDTYLVGGNQPSALSLNVACLSANNTLSVPDTAIGFFGVSRANSSLFSARASEANTSITFLSRSPRSENYSIYGRPADSTIRYVNARLAFYSIGEFLDLALLDARVTDLINAFGAAIP